MNSPATNAPFIAIACGGTGGHLFPGLAVAEQLQQRGAHVALLISPKDVDQQAVKNAGGLEVITLPAVALQRGSRLTFLSGFWNSWRAARKIFKARRPQAVLAMGGFTSAPPVLAARSLGAKTFLHESNTIPGRANRWLARLVDQAFIGFPQAAESLRVREATVTGTPVRAGFRGISTPPNPRDPLILVMGGSQGASGVNDLILATLPLIAKRAPHWRWMHLTGPNDADKVKAAYAKHEIHAEVHPFLADMSSAMMSATAAVSRAGASSLAEIAAVRLPALLIPLPAAADDHQHFNARAFEETGAARALAQKVATPEKVYELLHALVEDMETRRKMQLALEKWDAPAAAEQIADAILRAVGERANQPTEKNFRVVAADVRRRIGRTIQRDPSASSRRRLLGFGIWDLVFGVSFGFGVGSFWNA